MSQRSAYEKCIIVVLHPDHCKSFKRRERRGMDGFYFWRFASNWSKGSLFMYSCVQTFKLDGIENMGLYN